MQGWFEWWGMNGNQNLWGSCPVILVHSGCSAIVALIKVCWHELEDCISSGEATISKGTHEHRTPQPLPPIHPGSEAAG